MQESTTKSNFLKYFMRILGLIALIGLVLVIVLAFTGPSSYVEETITIALDGTTPEIIAVDVPRNAQWTSIEIVPNTKQWGITLHSTSNPSIYESRWTNLMGQHQRLALHMNYLIIQGRTLTDILDSSSAAYLDSPTNRFMSDGYLGLCPPFPMGEVLEVQVLDGFADSSGVELNITFGFKYSLGACISGLRGD
jgi:hypothetical protein